MEIVKAKGLVGKIVYDKRIKNNENYILVVDVIRETSVKAEDKVDKIYITIKGCDEFGKMTKTNHNLENLIEIT